MKRGSLYQTRALPNSRQYRNSMSSLTSSNNSAFKALERSVTVDPHVDSALQEAVDGSLSSSSETSSAPPAPAVKVAHVRV